MNTPAKFLEVRTYKKLRTYISAFSTKNMGLLIVVSRAGLGKSFLIERELETEAPLLLNSHVTPLKLYEMILEKTTEENNLDPLIVVDEAEMLFNNNKIKTMLKLLCDTRDEKTVRYSSTTPYLNKNNLPQYFTTRAKTVLLLNSLRPTDEHLKAILSRGHLLYFNPTDIEILTYLREWAEDKEIINFIKDFAPHSRNLNLRTYVKAIESKNSGLDWQAEIITELELDQRLLEVRNLLKSYKTDSERLKHWSSSRSTYFRFRKLYLNKQNSVKVS